MWSRLKKICLNSMTIAWSYCLALIGAALQAVDYIADPLGDPDLRSQISAAAGDSRIAGRILLAISIITIVARLRSLRKAV